MRWSKTDTPVTSLGSRSGVNCAREKRQSIERESAFASIVLPTPGASSRMTCPSATRAMTHRVRSVSGACTTRPTFSTIRRAMAAARRLSSAAESASTLLASTRKGSVPRFAGRQYSPGPNHHPVRRTVPTPM